MIRGTWLLLAPTAALATVVRSIRDLSSGSQEAGETEDYFVMASVLLLAVACLAKVRHGCICYL